MLSIVIPTYNDYSGIFMTVEGLVLYHDLSDTELVIIQNCPTENEHTRSTKGLINLIKSKVDCRYEVFKRPGTGAIRNYSIYTAKYDWVLSLDSHVLLCKDVIKRLKEWIKTNPLPHLYHGPLMQEDGINIAWTHFSNVWRGEMWGIAAVDDRGRNENNEPFEIWGSGTGLILANKKTWPGINMLFWGFGGEEGYIHEKYRKLGLKVMCLPWLRWVHRFFRMVQDAPPADIMDKVRNFIIGHLEIGLPLDRLKKHFVNRINEDGSPYQWRGVTETEWNTLVYEAKIALQTGKLPVNRLRTINENYKNIEELEEEALIHRIQPPPLLQKYEEVRKIMSDLQRNPQDQPKIQEEYKAIVENARQGGCGSCGGTPPPVQAIFQSQPPPQYPVIQQSNPPSPPSQPVPPPPLGQGYGPYPPQPSYGPYPPYPPYPPPQYPNYPQYPPQHPPQYYPQYPPYPPPVYQQPPIYSAGASPASTVQQPHEPHNPVLRNLITKEPVVPASGNVSALEEELFSNEEIKNIILEAKSILLINCSSVPLVRELLKNPNLEKLTLMSTVPGSPFVAMQRDYRELISSGDIEAPSESTDITKLKVILAFANNFTTPSIPDDAPKFDLAIYWPGYTYVDTSQKFEESNVGKVLMWLGKLVGTIAMLGSDLPSTMQQEDANKPPIIYGGMAIETYYLQFLRQQRELLKLQWKQNPGLIETIKLFFKSGSDIQRVYAWRHVTEHVSKDRLGVRVMSKLPKYAPELPSLASMAWRYISTRVTGLFNPGSLEEVPQELLKERLAICDKCRWLVVEENGEPRCSKCGCFLVRMPNGNPGRAALRSQVCPLGKWEEIDAKYIP